MFKCGDIVSYDEKYSGTTYGVVIEQRMDEVYASWELRTLEACLFASKEERERNDGFMKVDRVTLVGRINSLISFFISE